MLHSIHLIVIDEMKILRDGHVDPLRECLKIFDEEKPDSDVDLHSKGFLLFVHGSPCEGTKRVYFQK